MLFEVHLRRELEIPTVTSETKTHIEDCINNFYERIALNEIRTGGTIFRPSFLKLLPKLLKLRQRGKISNLFIYSNNGLYEAINTADRILAIVIQKQPYNVMKEELIKEKDNIIHVLSPRIFLDAACRIKHEPVHGSHFREKSLNGIRECVNDVDKLWFLDDTRHHTILLNELKERYVVVKPYNINIQNKTLADFFVKSFSIDAIRPDSEISSILLSGIEKTMPGFIVGTGDSDKEVYSKFIHALNKFSPSAKNSPIIWTKEQTHSDYIYLKTSLKEPLGISGGRRTRRK